jgi:hypothetical protein
MGFITVNAFNVDTRQFEPMLINAAFVVKVRRFEIGKGVKSAIELAPEGDWRALSESLEDVERLIGEIHDPDYAELKKLEKIFKS